MEVYLPPNKQLSWKTIAIPGQDNWSYNISDAWLASQMHLAGCLIAKRKAKEDVEAAAINELKFHVSLQMGDEVSCYAEVVSIYRTSLSVRVEAYVKRERSVERIKVAEGSYLFITKVNKLIQKPL
jgi:acyl-CoA thioesterase YciA